GFSRSIEDLAVEGDSLAGGPQWVSSERAPVADQVSPFNRGREPEILRRAVNDSDRYSPGDGDQTRGSASDRQEDGGNYGQGLGRGGPADGEPGNEFHGPLYGERVRFPGVVVKLVAYVKRERSQWELRRRQFNDAFRRGFAKWLVQDEARVDELRRAGL